MAQWTVAMDASVLAASPAGNCTFRCRTSSRDTRGQPLYVTMVLRDGQTVRSDDPEVIAALSQHLAAGVGKVVNTLAARPANPTHDVDTKPREPLPEGSRVAADTTRTR